MMFTKKTFLWLLFTCLMLSNLVAVVVDQTGFYTVPPVNYSFHDGSALSTMSFTSSEARLFTTFIKADRDAEHKPLFLFFNGGPGSGTSCGLMGFYTGRKTFDNRITGGGDHYIDNPYSWTKLGNLLYIDARSAGFSYSILPAGTPRSQAGVSSEFLGRNFNSYIDAADYIRVLLAFLADRPELQHNPVIIVGESYGGVRATLMLNMLLHYAQYGNGLDIYQDLDLVEQIQTHFDTVFPGYRGHDVPSAIIAQQFGHQVLIQPAIDYYRGYFDGPALEEPGSLVYQIAQETGTTFTPCRDNNCDPMSNIYEFIENVAKRDIYGCHKPAGWTDNFFNHAQDLLLDSKQFMAITGSDPNLIAELKPSARTQAYKYAYYGPAAGSTLRPEHLELFLELPADLQILTRRVEKRFGKKGPLSPKYHLPTVFGSLQPYDAYYNSASTDAFTAYYYLNATNARGYASYSYHPLTGQKFLQNLLDVKTFITNAKYDLVVYTNALPPGFGMHTNLVLSSLHQIGLPVQAARPGLIKINYISGEERTIRFPYYTKSSHPVSLTEPQEFYSDVSSWLKEN